MTSPVNTAENPAPATRGTVTRHALLALAVPVLFALDLWSGQEVTASLFYVPVVAYAGWGLGRTSLLIFAPICSGASLLADYLLSEPYLHFESSFSHPVTPFINALVRLSVYLLLGLNLSALRHALRLRDETVRELSDALARVRTLQGLLPICAWCRKVRDDEHESRWITIEQYVAERTDASVTHGICPSCESQLRTSMRAPGNHS